jgi:hypothetical protein
VIPSGEELPEKIVEQLRSAGADAHRSIVELLETEVAALKQGADTLFHPMAAEHAVKLACALKVHAAIRPLCSIVAYADSSFIIFNTALFALVDFGAAAVEDLLAQWAVSPVGGLAEALGKVGAGDERVFSALVGWLDKDPESAAMALADLGDPRAIEPIRAALAGIEYDPSGGPFRNHVLIEMTASIEALGGALTATEQQKLDHVDADAATFREAIELGAAARKSSVKTLPAAPKHPRNAPCWCGSGVKYKKCHEPEPAPAV